ncbi:MAG: hypothetical protein QOF18_361 [Frankiaceae bacterium]|nr:hypothetical protein [Frankiaceae bacterium]
MAAPLVILAITLSGCSSSPHRAVANASPPSSPAAQPSPNAGAERLIHAALTATGQVRSYRFSATTTVAARQAVRTVIVGRVVRGEGLAYRLRVGQQRTQVVRTRRATFVRGVPGHWARLQRPRPIANPTASLRAVLAGLTATKVSPAPGGAHRVRGSLSPAAARRAGIPTDRRPADVVVTLDRRARVTGLTISTSTSAGTHSVTVTVHSTYGGFDRIARISAPI